MTRANFPVVDFPVAFSAGTDGRESFCWSAAQVHTRVAVQVSLHVERQERRAEVRVRVHVVKYHFTELHHGP